MALTFTVLGCGNSTGVPAAGNYWGKCSPEEPKNKRTRPSLLVQSNTTTIVIDTGPDFSLQATHHDINQVDAVLYTHSHGDHVHGIDDLKIYAKAKPDGILPAFTNHETILELKRRFCYLFEGGNESIYQPMLQTHALDDRYGQTVTIGDINFIPFEQTHGKVRSVGYRFGDFAYSTDMKHLNAQSIDILRGVKTWIVDSAGYHQENNPVHASLKEIYALNKHVQAQNVYLTSLSLAMDYETMISELPDGYLPLYDGKTFTA